jgi:6-phosphogluconolactonase
MRFFDHKDTKGTKVLKFFVIFVSLWFLLPARTNSNPVAQQNFNGRAFIYINNNDFENSVSAFSVGEDGRLRQLPGSPFSTGGLGGKTSAIGGLCICRRVRQLYVTNNADDTVSGFRINLDGTLKRIPGSPVFTGGRFPAGVICNRLGTKLFVANLASDSIATFTIDGNSIQQIDGSPLFRAGNGPLALAINRAGTLLFASQEFDRSVGSYQIDSAGRLRQIGVFPTFGLTEHGMVLYEPASRIYVAAVGGNSVSGFKADMNTGILSGLPNSPYFTDGDRPIDVAIHPAGSFVFASNNNNSAITAFSVNSDGSLRAVPGSPFTTDGQGPAGMVINDLGTLLFVVNGGFAGSRDISVYRIDQSGRISPVLGSPFPLSTIGTPSAIGLFEAAPAPTITGVGFAMKKRRLIISGTDLAPSPEITINNRRVDPTRIISAGETEIVLSGKPENLNLRPGENRIIITVRDLVSNTFILNF